MNYEAELEIREKVAEILTKIRDEKPSYDEIVDVAMKYGANSTEEIRNSYVRAEFFTDVKDKELKKQAFKVTFVRIPCDNKSATTVRLSDTCHVSVGINCINTDRKHYTIVHKNGKLALV